jgi:hypothetical protein
MVLSAPIDNYSLYQNINRQLGGMFVLDKGMKNIVYEFREKFAGTYFYINA